MQNLMDKLQRVLLVLVVVILISVSLLACSKYYSTAVTLTPGISIYVDDETGVNYLIYKTSNGGAGICPRYGSDGKILIKKEN